MTWLWNLLLGGLTNLVKPVFEFLNKRVDANAQMHISDNATMTALGGAAIGAIQNADNLNTSVRLKEGAFSPWVVMTIAGFMAPFAWHTWQVCLDSSRWLPSFDWVWGFIPYPTVAIHVVGSWKVAALPGLFETTEHAVIQSLFVGASAGVAFIMAARAARGR